MSGSLLTGFSGAAAASITNVLIRPYRAIGTVIPQVERAILAGQFPFTTGEVIRQIP